MLDPHFLSDRLPWPAAALMALLLVPVALLMILAALGVQAWWATRALAARSGRLMAGHRAQQTLYLVPLILACISAWLLSACGTQPLRAETSLQVPAELMARSSRPVLLTPASTSSMPSPTSGPTRPAAQPIEPGSTR